MCRLAIAIANDSDFGLSGGVYTNGTDRACAIASSARAGHFTQNGREFDLTLTLVPRQGPRSPVRDGQKDTHARDSEY